MDAFSPRRNELCPCPNIFKNQPYATAVTKGSYNSDVPLKITKEGNYTNRLNSKTLHFEGWVVNSDGFL